jgi:predicted HTH transcriptional regulator
MNKEELLQMTKELYRLTLLFPKKEPLRYKMREVANEILALFLDKKSKDSPIFQIKLDILDAFFEIAIAQNWVKNGEILALKQQYNNLKSTIKETPKNSPPRPQISLSALQRQQKIVELLKEKNQIQVWEVKQIFPQVSKRTLRRDFANLVKAGIIERVGSQNNTFYKLKTQ